MLLNFQNQTKIRVRYSETDQMGYCYYGNYAQYFEVGRVEALRSTGISYKTMEDQGVMLPVSDFSVSYKNPAYYDDELTITTHITEVKGARIFFEYTITNNLNQIIALANTTLVFVNKTTMRPIQPPQDFLDNLKTFIVNE
jgi:acyl-CoA thioester hydrolase